MCRGMLTTISHPLRPDWRLPRDWRRPWREPPGFFRGGDCDCHCSAPSSSPGNHIQSPCCANGGSLPPVIHITFLTGVGICPVLTVGGTYPMTYTAGFQPVFGCDPDGAAPDDNGWVFQCNNGGPTGTTWTFRFSCRKVLGAYTWFVYVTPWNLATNQLASGGCLTPCSMVPSNCATLNFDCTSTNSNTGASIHFVITL